MQDLISIQQQLEDLILQIEPVLRVYHAAKSDLEILEDQKKTILAAYEISFVNCKSQAEIQRRALACEGYKEFLKGLTEARRVFNRAWANLEGLRIKMECLRSLNKYLQ